MYEQIDTVIVGGGQAGLATSYCLAQQGIAHVVLEKKDRPAPVWDDERWDSFTLVTPNWAFRLPGAEYCGDRPDDFMARAEVTARMRQYVERYRLPLRCGVETVAVDPAVEPGLLRVCTGGGGYTARNVVIATGLFQRPASHPAAAQLPAEVLQLHSSQYRHPAALPEGATLVVGSSQSGCQIADELRRHGRPVYLSVGSSPRLPRRYRGRDCTQWLELMGIWDKTVDTLPSPQAKFAPSPQLSGRLDGDLNLHRLVAEGVRLLGRVGEIDGDTLRLRNDLAENIEKADRMELMFLAAVDRFVEARGLDSPVERRPVRREAYAIEPDCTVSLQQLGIRSVVWATGYGFDFGMVHFPVLDADGFPMQQRGETAVPGLYFVGLPWLHKQKSGLIAGVGEDAAFVSSCIVKRKLPGRVPQAVDAVD